MSPHQEPKPHFRDPHPHLESQTSQDKERHEEEEDHHPMLHPYPHPPHHSQGTLDLRPDHDAHTNIPHDELPPHHNAPSPIKPSKKMTPLGRE